MAALVTAVEETAAREELIESFLDRITDDVALVLPGRGAAPASGGGLLRRAFQLRLNLALSRRAALAPHATTDDDGVSAVGRPGHPPRRTSGIR